MWTFVQLRTIVQFLPGSIGIWIPVQKREVWNAWLEERMHLHLTHRRYARVWNIYKHMWEYCQYYHELQHVCQTRARIAQKLTMTMSWQSDVNTMIVTMTISVSLALSLASLASSRRVRNSASAMAWHSIERLLSGNSNELKVPARGVCEINWNKPQFGARHLD